MFTRNTWRTGNLSLLFVMFVMISTLLTGCRSGPFIIKNENFQATDVCDGTGTIEISMEGGEVSARALGKVEVEMLKDGMPSIWCHGLKHQFMGRVELHGYTFNSDPSDPLTFTVDRDKGYYYTSGKGTVTDPNGKVTTLP